MTAVKDMPESEKPREKALKYGVGVLSNRELLALILRSGPRGSSVLEVADKLLMLAGGLAGLPRMLRKDMTKVRGISDVKALELLACFEIAKRIAFEQLPERYCVRDSGDLKRWLRLRLGSSTQEEFLVIFLDRQKRIICAETLFRGTGDTAAVSVSEIFRRAVSLSCSAIFAVHNHPSGSLEASEADLRMTAALIEAGHIMGIEVMDHLIVSQNGVLSIREQGEASLRPYMF